jgi:hypothetical protein
LTSPITLPKLTDFELFVEEFDFGSVQAVLDNLPIMGYVLVGQAQYLTMAA